MDIGLCDEMLRKAIEHFVQGPLYDKKARRQIQTSIGKYDELLNLDDFTCGVTLFIVILVIYKYKKR